jgi:hypothetical protein
MCAKILIPVISTVANHLQIVKFLTLRESARMSPHISSVSYYVPSKSRMIRTELWTPVSAFTSTYVHVLHIHIVKYIRNVHTGGSVYFGAVGVILMFVFLIYYLWLSTINSFLGKTAFVLIIIVMNIRAIKTPKTSGLTYNGSRPASEVFSFCFACIALVMWRR